MELMNIMVIDLLPDKFLSFYVRGSGIMVHYIDKEG